MMRGNQIQIYTYFLAFLPSFHKSTRSPAAANEPPCTSSKKTHSVPILANTLIGSYQPPWAAGELLIVWFDLIRSDHFKKAFMLDVIQDKTPWAEKQSMPQRARP